MGFCFLYSKNNKKFLQMQEFYKQIQGITCPFDVNDIDIFNKYSKNRSLLQKHLEWIQDKDILFSGLTYFEPITLPNSKKLDYRELMDYFRRGNYYCNRYCVVKGDMRKNMEMFFHLTLFPAGYRNIYKFDVIRRGINLGWRITSKKNELKIIYENDKNIELGFSLTFITEYDYLVFSYTFKNFLNKK